MNEQERVQILLTLSQSSGLSAHERAIAAKALFAMVLPPLTEEPMPAMREPDVGSFADLNAYETTRHHAPDRQGLLDITAIRERAREFIREILERCPPCGDASAAIRKVREAMMTANAAIALKGIS